MTLDGGVSKWDGRRVGEEPTFSITGKANFWLGQEGRLFDINAT